MDSVDKAVLPDALWGDGVFPGASSIAFFPFHADRDRQRWLYADQMTGDLRAASGLRDLGTVRRGVGDRFPRRDQGRAFEVKRNGELLSMGIICQQCSRDFSGEKPMVSMSGSIMGDEYTDSYFLCPICQLYTMVSWRDNFTGIETMRISGPISRQEGDTRVALISRCSRSWDKKCRCEAHRIYFRDTLD